MPISYNPFPDEPELGDLIFEADRSTKLSLNCHAIAVLESFDAETQTAIAQITYQRVSFQQSTDAATLGTYIPIQTPYPLLMQCPVIFLGGGGSNLQFPVAKGDECLVLFNDRDIDNWWATGGTSVQLNSGRLHAISDAIIIVGIRSKPMAIKNFDGSRVVLAGADSPTAALLGVSPTQASLESGGPTGTKVAAGTKATIQVDGVTLGTELQQLMTELSTLVTAIQTAYGAFATAGGLDGTIPNTTSAFTAQALLLTPIITALNAIKTILGNILT